MAEYRTVCAAAELAPGHARLFRWEGREIAVFRDKAGALHAIDDTCMHAGGPLHEGSLRDGVVVCPWHHWEFDLADGSCRLNPYHRLGVYEAREIHGRVEVRV